MVPGFQMVEHQLVSIAGFLNSFYCPQFPQICSTSKELWQGLQCVDEWRLKYEVRSYCGGNEQQLYSMQQIAIIWHAVTNGNCVACCNGQHCTAHAATSMACGNKQQLYGVRQKIAATTSVATNSNCTACGDKQQQPPQWQQIRSNCTACGNKQRQPPQW